MRYRFGRIFRRGVVLCQVAQPTLQSREKFETPAIVAGRGGKLRVLEELIGAGANLEISDEDGWTVLHWVAQEGHLSLVNCILDRAPILLNVHDKRGLTPLHVAAWAGNRKMVQRLIAEGANVNAETSWGETPLHHAVYFGHTEVCETLLVAGAASQREDKMKRSPHSIAKARHLEDILALIDKFSK